MLYATPYAWMVRPLQPSTFVRFAFLGHGVKYLAVSAGASFLSQADIVVRIDISKMIILFIG